MSTNVLREVLLSHDQSSHPALKPNLSSSHDQILEKSTSYWVVAFRIANNDIPCLDDIMLTSCLASPTDLVVVAVLLRIGVDEIWVLNHLVWGPGHPIRHREELPQCEKIQVGELAPIPAKLDRVFEVTALGYDGKLQPAISRHCFLAGMVPNCFAADCDLRFLVCKILSLFALLLVSPLLALALVNFSAILF
jgi:hypothetical protein